MCITKLQMTTSTMNPFQKIKRQMKRKLLENKIIAILISQSALSEDKQIQYIEKCDCLQDPGIDWPDSKMFKMAYECIKHNGSEEGVVIMKVIDIGGHHLIMGKDKGYGMTALHYVCYSGTRRESYDFSLKVTMKLIEEGGQQLVMKKINL